MAKRRRILRCLVLLSLIAGEMPQAWGASEAPPMGKTDWVADGDCYIKSLQFVDTFEGGPINIVWIETNDNNTDYYNYLWKNNTDGSLEISIVKYDVDKKIYSAPLMYGHYSPSDSSLSMNWVYTLDNGTGRDESCKYHLTH